MRSMIVVLALPLAACGGAGVGLSSVGSTAVGSATPTGTPTPTPTPTPASTTSTTTTTPPTPTQANLFDVQTATTFDATTALHSLAVDKNGATLYQGNASTAAAPGGTISYDPRDGIFVMTLTDGKAGVSRTIRFQDPLHRVTTDSAYVEKQVPVLAGFNYLDVLDGTTPLTFFYQRPNTAGSFVSLAGFERNQVNDDKSTESEQGVLVFGTRTAVDQTPLSGAAHYDGQFLATMIEQQGGSTPVQQWMNGTSAVDVDFGKRSVALNLTGTVGPAFVKNTAVPDPTLAVPTGSTFTAVGSASWTAASTAFSGKFSSAGFSKGATSTPVDFTSVAAANGTPVAGASSIDGAFYGPDTKNIGGNFRIVGGIPNQRVDILGGFVGTKK
jgi:hypothetical protein